MSLIYPSLGNVKASLDGMLGGACLPYMSSTHARQSWLMDHLWQWKSDGRFRSRAVPHIKTYAQVSPNGKRAGWFVMTSANLSKAAWGGPVPTGLHIRSYEVGVLFLPKFLVSFQNFLKNIVTNLSYLLGKKMIVKFVLYLQFCLLLQSRDIREYMYLRHMT